MNGQPLAHAWEEALTDLRIEREFQVPGKCTLRFTDPGYVLLAGNTVKLGTKIVVSAVDGGELIQAEVTGIGVEQQEGRHPDLVVVAHDKSHRLGRATTVATYLEMKYSDVVSKLASAAGLATAVDSTALKLDYLLQVDSDLGLITELARRAGFDWWVDGATLHFKKPKAAPVVKLKLHEELRTFSVRATGHRPDSFTVDGWDRQKQAQVTSTATTASAPVKAISPLATLVASPAGAFGKAIVLTAGIAAASQDEADQLSAALAQRAAACAVTARGEAEGTSHIKLGCVIDVDDAGPLSGKYPVTKVEHIYGTGVPFATRFVAGDRRPTSLVDVLAGSRPAARPATHHTGLAVGEVTNINDPLKLGRVKVRFPGLSETDESAWARLVAVGGGKSRGNVFIPEVHDEVLVGFESGDPRQPVVIGGLYGDKSTIPAWAVEGGKVNARGMTSRLGHVVTLSDGTTPADQFVMLQLAGQKHTFRVAKDKVDLEVPSGTPVNVKAGSTSIVFSASGDITIEAQNITIKASMNLKFEAGMNGEMKAGTQLALEGSTQASLKGAVLQMEGSGQASLKGGIVQIN
ncbi:MAG: VgrG-related protein [Actinomycetota bacterium]|nr:VgrG-related protein [Actinomycetota bacterium]